MNVQCRQSVFCSVVFLMVSGAAFAGDRTPPPVEGCALVAGNLFEDQVWAKVGALKCLVCHRKGGEAAASQFLLVDPAKSPAGERASVLRTNFVAFTRMAKVKEKDQSRLLLKITGKLDHGGADVLPADSAGYRIMADFVRRVNNPASPSLEAKADPHAPPFFRGVAMLDDRRLLRRLTLSLAGRLPTEQENATVTREGLKSFGGLLDALMREEAFYDRLREGFNDIFLTLGVDGNADQTVLSYEHFEKTRLWYQKFDLSHIADKNERQRTEWKIAAEYRKTILEEPMRLIDHIVRNDRPFTEILTADYIMVSPYSSRGYGVFEEVKSRFKNANDPYEYVPVRLKALVGRSKQENQESPSGFYPHAGVLSTFQYLTRYPTTETNRNRLRARMYYQHFLGVDVLELAARVSDAAAASAKFKIPTMQAPECVVCHQTLDPVAGLFQDYWRFADQGVHGRRKGGWFTDMFAAGFEGEALPASDRWRALQWLGERTARDPRFAVAMTGHVYQILFGRKLLLPPVDIEDPMYAARWRAHAEQRRVVNEIADRFARNGHNLKSVFKDWALSDYYRADVTATPVNDACRRAELDDVGVMRLLSPEQLERKIDAVFGEKWGKLKDQFALLYGGIDSREVTDRATDPGGAMGAIQRGLSNDVACRHVARDFAKPAASRRLFRGIEPTVVPGQSAEGDRAIRATIVGLHERILGRIDAADSAEVERTLKLFAGIISDAKNQKGIDPRENYFCRPDNKDAPASNANDPTYAIRAWRGVVTYLLRRPEFLYE